MGERGFLPGDETKQDSLWDKSKITVTIRCVPQDSDWNSSLPISGMLQTQMKPSTLWGRKMEWCWTELSEVLIYSLPILGLWACALVYQICNLSSDKNNQSDRTVVKVLEQLWDQPWDIKCNHIVECSFPPWFDPLVVGHGSRWLFAI